MSFRKKIKNNTPKVELQSIMTLVAGGYKTGKTRLWKEVTELHYSNPEEALLLSFEDGYETWQLDNIVPLHDEGTDKNLWKVWDYFKKTVVPELVQEAKTGRIVKLIGVDTADRAIDACTAWILYDRNKRYGKTFESLQDISESTNGKENGWTALYEELKKPFDTLKNAGYGLMFLAWTKEKETTLYDGMKYNSVQLMMPNSGRKVFESQASLICCLHNEVSVLDKQGNELEDNIKDKKGRDKASNFHDTKVMMYFRPSEYVEIAGGRYTELPEKVEYSAENFLKTFENAVLGQIKKTNRTVHEIKKEEEQLREEKVQEAAGLSRKVCKLF
ncbi:AAA family ATPase [Bacillus subtilis]|uniref:AAA family ATPase n=1 Tax=Bacillus subtilis TaxID=1423 RepID=UPI000A815239|nr:AAA family ATPase [Bacillus subtilis]